MPSIGEISNQPACNNASDVIFYDKDLGQNMGVNSKGIYSGSYIFVPGNTTSTTYYLQFKLLDPENIGINSSSMGILGHTSNMSNQISIFELYAP